MIPPKGGNLNSLINVQQETLGDIARGAGIGEELIKFKPKRESITLFKGTTNKRIPEIQVKVSHGKNPNTTPKKV